MNEELLDSGGDVCVPASTLTASSDSSTGKGAGAGRDGVERREGAGASSRARTPRQSESSELPGVVGVLAGVPGCDTSASDDLTLLRLAGRSFSSRLCRARGSCNKAKHRVPS